MLEGGEGGDARECEGSRREVIRFCEGRLVSLLLVAGNGVTSGAWWWWEQAPHPAFYTFQAACHHDAVNMYSRPLTGVEALMVF